MCLFSIFTSRCASRHNGVHFFNISTSKSVPNPLCFSHFDFQACFAPDRRPPLQHLNFQKCSERDVFWCVLAILTSKCASHRNGVQFLSIWIFKSAPNVVCFDILTFDFRTVCTFATSQLPRVLRTCCVFHSLAPTTMGCNSSSLIWPDGSAPATLASLLFDPPGPQNIGTTRCFATFYVLERLDLLSAAFLFSDLLSSSFLFSDSSHLCFSICPYWLSEVWLLNFLRWMDLHYRVLQP